MPHNISRRSKIDQSERYVSRAAYKLDSVSHDLGLDYQGKTVLDVGSSSGGFSDYALKHGARKVIAVEKGTNQMDQLLRLNDKIELHEKTDIRSFSTTENIDLVLIDVSFISVTSILDKVAELANSTSDIVVMAKPQFETNDDRLKNKGIIKNERIRRQILARLELSLRLNFIIKAKADSKVLGVKGNRERFYLLRCSK